MRKLHWVSLALIAAPVVVMHACGGDDTTPGNPATSTGGSGGTGGGATGGKGGGGTGGGATGGNAGTAGTGGMGGSGGSAGSGGSKTDGGGGSATDGGGGSVAVDAGDAKVDVPIVDAPTEGGTPNKTCTDPAAYMDSGIGQSCNDYCTTFMDVCNSDPALGDSGAFYANGGDCRQKCSNFSQAQLCCYAVHVNNAAANDGGARSNHCTHAAGVAGQNVCPAHP